jgi:hypothetical protein
MPHTSLYGGAARVALHLYMRTAAVIHTYLFIILFILLTLKMCHCEALSMRIS